MRHVMGGSRRQRRGRNETVTRHASGPPLPPWLVLSVKVRGPRRSQEVRDARRSRTTGTHVSRTAEVMCSAPAARFEGGCQEQSGKEAGEQGRAQASPPCWTEFSLAGTGVTCRDLHGTMCRWGLMNVVMIMMIIIQILPYLCAPGRPGLLSSD